MRRIAKVAGLVTGLAFLAFVGVILAAQKSPGYAETINQRNRHQPTAAPANVVETYTAPARSAWGTGCGVGIHGSWVNADLDTGSPITLSSTGRLVGLEGFCDAVWNNFLIGAFASYDWVYGDLHTIGVDNVLTVGGRFGYVIQGVSLLYGHAGWVQADGSGIPDTTGIKFGLGLETKLPNAPVYVDLRVSRSIYDGAVGPMDVDADEIRLGLRYKLDFLSGGSRAVK